MSIKVCLTPSNTLYYPMGGGHFWVYLNWAMGLRALGCEVIWLETVYSDIPARVVRQYVAVLKNRLKRYGLAERVALCSESGEPLPREATEGCLDHLEVAAEADLLLNLRYGLPSEVVGASSGRPC